MGGEGKSGSDHKKNHLLERLESELMKVERKTS